MVSGRKTMLLLLPVCVRGVSASGSSQDSAQGSHSSPPHPPVTKSRELAGPKTLEHLVGCAPTTISHRRQETLHAL